MAQSKTSYCLCSYLPAPPPPPPLSPSFSPFTILLRLFLLLPPAVALEQSERSQSLTSFQLPAKTALLLGNEKQGIPANILAAGHTLIDACVEIPQCGVIRSLNVHVSGALLMWEFVKQHIFKDTAGL